MFDTRRVRAQMQPAIVSWLPSRISRGIAFWLMRRSAARPSAQFPQAEISWKRSRQTTWAATRADQFLGMVEEVDGCYVANDTARGTYNTYRTLREAMEAFGSPSEGRPVRTR